MMTPGGGDDHHQPAATTTTTMFFHPSSLGSPSRAPEAFFFAKQGFHSREANKEKEVKRVHGGFFHSVLSRLSFCRLLASTSQAFKAGVEEERPAAGVVVVVEERPARGS